MGSMIARKKKVMMMLQGGGLIDTSPKIAKYDKGCDYASVYEGQVGERDFISGCITEWYLFNPQQLGRLTIYNYCKNTAYRVYNYQYSTEDYSFSDWYYETGHGRTVGPNSKTLYRIRFTLDVETIDNCYAYCSETGQIFFAGKDSIYYGYTNINDMPT